MIYIIDRCSILYPEITYFHVNITIIYYVFAGEVIVFQILESLFGNFVKLKR